jgi:hypothetical protein
MGTPCPPRASGKDTVVSYSSHCPGCGGIGNPCPAPLMESPGLQSPPPSRPTAPGRGEGEEPLPLPLRETPGLRSRPPYPPATPGWGEAGSTPRLNLPTCKADTALMGCRRILPSLFKDLNCIRRAVCRTALYH